MAPLSRTLRATVMTPFRRFFALQSAGGVLLIVATILALAAANSGLAEAYHHFLETTIGLRINGFGLEKPLHFWVNDLLMAVFFFLVGLEIKREILVGELASIRKAALPIAAAVGGMAVPALIYVIFNSGTASLHGWAIPTATDIAFALGIMNLLGRRVPIALTVFLTALAIVDDMGAVMIIAAFYSEGLQVLPLFVATGAFALALLLNSAHARHPGWYLVVGGGLWFGLLYAGVHPTIAGVLMGLTIPVRGIYDDETWLARVTALLKRYRDILADRTLGERQELSARQDAVAAIEEVTERAQSPLIRLEHGLQPWVSFIIMPVFAFANAGVTISGTALSHALASSVTIGVFLGLLFGKQIGVLLASWLSVRLGVAALPSNVTWRQIYGASILAGIGFTMSLFITELSFARGAEEIDLAKIGILAGSLVAGVAGYLLLRFVGHAPEPESRGPDPNPRK